jgi:hypothetical protein
MPNLEIAGQSNIRTFIVKFRLVVIHGGCTENSRLQIALGSAKRPGKTTGQSVSFSG